MFGRFLGRFNHACLEYALGAGSPKFSLRVVNIVPKWKSPVFREVFFNWGRRRVDPTYGEDQCFEALKKVEHAVLSLYRDGKSSPWDVTEMGETHGAVRDSSTPRQGT